MGNNLEKELYKAAALTFEEMGFMFLAPELQDCYRAAPVDAAVSVAFSGPFAGRLVVQIRGNLLPAIAANMLGEDEAPSLNQQRDALGEIANVICGNVLPRIAGSREVFDIRAPEAGPGATGSAASVESPPVEVQMAMEQGLVELRLFIDDRRAE